MAEADAIIRVEIPGFWPSGDDWYASAKFDGFTPVSVVTPECRSSIWDGAERLLSRRELNQDYYAGRPKQQNSNCEINPVILTAAQPRLEITDATVFDVQTPESGRRYRNAESVLPYVSRGAEIDLGLRQLRFPVRVTTSLGFSGDTYAKLALAGTILSGFLGTGWAWKLIELFKPKPTTPSPVPTPTVEPTSPTAVSRGKRADNGKRRK